ncbi:unnamed protein product, partial [Didymodactylos carnosus]
MCASRIWPIPPGAKQHKLALVIGNTIYESGNSLRNPVHDANDMTTALESIGFKVMKGLDLKYNDMKSQLAEFVRRIE